MRGLIAIPTRGRHEKLGLLLDQIEATRQGDSHFLILTDADDPAPAPLRRRPWITAATRPREWLTPKLNRALVPVARQGYYGAVGWMADDTWPETPGWDAMLLAELEDAPGIAWPHSDRRPGFPEHQLVSSVIVRRLGWYFEPSLRHYYTDNVWADLAEAAGCGRYVKQAMVRHDHYAGGRDATYSEAEVNGHIDADLYLRWRGMRMTADAGTVRQAIDESTKAR